MRARASGFGRHRALHGGGVSTREDGSRVLNEAKLQELMAGLESFGKMGREVREMLDEVKSLTRSIQHSANVSDRGVAE
jgi:hypothetical protein